MMLSIKQRKRGKKKNTERTKDSMKMELIFMPEDGVPDGDSESEEEFDAGGMYLEKEDVLMIYTAMKHYKPSQEEEVLYSTLLESFEEILVVDYDVKLPDVVY
jgi:hypothetical protein